MDSNTILAVEVVPRIQCAARLLEALEASLVPSLSPSDALEGVLLLLGVASSYVLDARAAL